MTYEKLLNQLPQGSKPTYGELLRTHEWKSFRNSIVNNQKEKCQDCGAVVYRDETQEEWQKRLVSIEVEVLANPFIYLLDKDTTDPELYEKMKIRNNPIRSKQFVKVLPPVILEVHHTYYIKGALPWEYPESSLQTLCSDCHHNKHFDADGNKLTRVKVYSDKSRSVVISSGDCSKCGGIGYIPEFKHRDAGVCYECGGSGILGFWDSAKPLK